MNEKDRYFFMKILIVEDEDLVRDFLVEALIYEGFDVHGAMNGVEGLSLFVQFQPHVVITDIEMPKVDGFELLKAIRRRDSDVLVMMSTGNGSEESAIRALQLGANDYIPKPISLGKLLQILRKYEAILHARTLEQEILGMITNREFTMKIGNDIKRLPKIVDYLLQETSSAIPQKQRLGVHLGLIELITNAVEHGNLGITGDEKGQALMENNLLNLYAQRMVDEKYKDKKVTIHFNMNEEECEWTIYDEGEGFNWNEMLNPLLSEGLFELHGRGIFLSRLQFNEMEYLGTGNIVRIKKKLRE